MIHGGDIYNNKITMDLSVNINPAGCPICVKEALMKAAGKVSVYPEYDHLSLRKLIGEAVGTVTETIVCGNGASEIITGIGHVFRGRKVLIPVPSFAGYERAFYESEIIFHYLKDSKDFEIDNSLISVIREKRPEILVLANPNNPTGKLVKGELRNVLIKTAAECGCTLVIDESFIDLSEGAESFLDHMDGEASMIVIRSLTKSYAIPGVRIGYSICSDKELAESLSRALSEWNISVFADEAGKAVFSEWDREGYLADSRALINKMRGNIYTELGARGIRYIKSDTDYILFKHRRGLYEDMLLYGILIRDCSTLRGLGEGWYRITVCEGSSSIVFLRML